MDVERVLEEEFGPIAHLEQMADGIYFVLVEREELPFYAEYYAITTETPLISSEAKEYGTPLPNCPDILLYDRGNPGGGAVIVYYECQRYKVQNGLPVLESLSDIAAHGMELNPEYFGTYPIPAETPYGRVTRCRTLANGIYWLETEQGREVLSIAYPLWDDLTDYTQWRAQPKVLKPWLKMDGGKIRYVGMDSENESDDEYKGTLFFSKKFSCLAIFELSSSHPEWLKSGLVDKPAIMNAIWDAAPEYAVGVNKLEILGENDLPGKLLRSFGIEAERRCLPKRLIPMSPEAGTEFLRFDQRRMD